jgi:hypothetical protein
MERAAIDSIESRFLSLAEEEKVSVITHGAALLLSEWKKRLFLAESKVRHFENKYHCSLAQFELKGLPDNANHEMHEDYIMWHHWSDAIGKAKKQVLDLEAITSHGLRWKT